MVLDDHHRIAEVHQTVQHVEQFPHVVEVQSGGGFVQDIKSAAGLPLGKLFGQLDALRLATG